MVYPPTLRRRLRYNGDQIPLLVRIVSVADSFHALITTRPYRPASSIARALEILREASGTRWDPVVVAAMVHLVRPAGAGSSVQRRLEAGGF
ncbi:MAG: HD-GYP domain-containing protein [Vulcanimicrobiaceae bacterium]